MRAHFVGLAFSTVRTTVTAAAFAALVSASAVAAEVDVITGDFFRVAEKQWRIANIDAPRIEGTCSDEARLGLVSQAKLAEILAQGEMEIAPQGGRIRSTGALALRMNAETSARDDRRRPRAASRPRTGSVPGTRLSRPRQRTSAAGLDADVAANANAPAHELAPPLQCPCGFSHMGATPFVWPTLR